MGLGGKLNRVEPGKGGKQPQPLNINTTQITHRKGRACPRVIAALEDIDVETLVDTGSQISAVSQEWYETHKNALKGCPELPIPAITIKGAFGGKARTVKKQLLCRIGLGETKTEAVILVVDGLSLRAVLGSDWCLEYGVKIDFANSTITVGEQGGAMFHTTQLSEEEGADIAFIQDLICEAPKEENMGHPPEDHHAIEFDQQVQGMIDAANISHHEERQQLTELLMDHKELFENRIGHVRDFSYKINMKPIENYKVRPYPIPYHLQPKVQEQINQWIKEDIIEPGESPYINPLVVAPKKDGSIRACLDARKINTYMIPDYQGVPNIEDLFARLGKAKIMSSIDLTSAFLQVPLDEESRKYTGFMFNNTVYRFKRVPFGTKNSMAALAHCLDHILGHEFDEWVIIFADDILILGESFEQHLEILRKVFKRFSEHGITLKLAKSEFCRKEIKFLGHVVKVQETGTTIEPDPKKLEILEEFPRPTTRKKLKGFIGLALFYSKFHPKFAEFTTPLNRLLRKGAKWEWKEEHERSYQKIKELFKELYLHIPDFGKPMYVQTDASNYAISGWLYQKERKGLQIIGCVSRSLKGAEICYTTTEKELLAIIFTLEKLRHYLLFQKFTIFTDNKALSFLQKVAFTNQRLMRWILRLQAFDFNVEHCKGTENTVADIFSRLDTAGREGEIQDVTITLAAMKVIGEERWAEWLSQVKRRHREERDEHPRFEYQVKNGFRFINIRGKWKLDTPEDLLEELIKMTHQEWGHFATQKIYTLLGRYVHGKKLRKRIKKAVQCCEVCQRVKGNTQRAELKNIITSKPNEMLAVDLYGPLIKNNGGQRYIFVTVDMFSKYVKLYPIKRPTAKNCKILLKNRQFAEVGKPESIISDRGNQFKSKTFEEFLRREKVRHIKTSILHPMGNGMVERINREITELLRIYCINEHQEWTEWVDHIEHVINSTVNASTGYPPREVHFNQESHLFPRELLEYPEEDQQESYDLKLVKTRINLRLAARKNKQQYDKRKANLKYNFQVGTEVMIRINPFAHRKPNEMSKLRARYEGPYIIKKKISDNTYLIVDAEQEERGVYHANMLKPYFLEIRE